jgi:hypothetical protein
MKHSVLALTLAVAGAVTAAHAATPSRVRGTVKSLSGLSLVIAETAGDTVTLALPETATVTAITPSTLAGVKPGSYVGTAAVPQPDGTLRALELQVFPESMRGVGEGTRPWDLGAQSSMTNGTVGGQVEGSDGRSLTIKYGNGEKRVFVPANVPVVTYEPGSRAMLTPGAHVLIFATEADDGALTAGRVTVGKDGLTPPM